MVRKETHTFVSESGTDARRKKKGQTDSDILQNWGVMTGCFPSTALSTVPAGRMLVFHVYYRVEDECERVWVIRVDVYVICG